MEWLWRLMNRDRITHTAIIIHTDGAWDSMYLYNYDTDEDVIDNLTKTYEAKQIILLTGKAQFVL